MLVTVMHLEECTPKHPAQIMNTPYCENGHKLSGSPFKDPNEFGHGCLEPSCEHHICILVDRILESSILGYICPLHKHKTSMTGAIGSYIDGCDGTGHATPFCANGHLLVQRTTEASGDNVGCIHPICYHTVTRAQPPRNAAERKMAGTPLRAKSKIKVPHGGPGRMPARYWLQRLASKVENTPPEDPETIITVSPSPGFEVTVVNTSVITSLPRQEAKLSATTSTEGINDNHSTTTNSEVATVEAA